MKLNKALLLTLGGLVAARQVQRAHRLLDLHGKLVLVNGASRGLGLALAREFGRQGASLVITARDAEELRSAETELKRAGIATMALVCDLTQADQIRATIEHIYRSHGQIDVLVNNAGVIGVGPIETMQVSDFEEAMNTNFWAAVHSCLAVMPMMKRAGGGRIVNIASIGGKMPVPHLVPYSASKFALVGFSGGLRTELQKDNILVTTINPGLMRTGSPRHAKFKGNQRAEYTWFTSSDAMPGLSMDAKVAAKKIVSACVHGDAELTLGLPGKIGALAYGMFSSWNVDIAGYVAQLMPRSNRHFQSAKSGSQIPGDSVPGYLKEKNRQAEVEYNQLHS